MAKIRDVNPDGSDVVTGNWGGYYCPNAVETKKHLEELHRIITHVQQNGLPLQSGRNPLDEIRSLYTEVDLLLDRLLELSATS
jgi:hypothetical protein